MRFRGRTANSYPAPLKAELKGQAQPLPPPPSLDEPNSTAANATNTSREEKKEGQKPMPKWLKGIVSKFFPFTQPTLNLFCESEADELIFLCAWQNLVRVVQRNDVREERSERAKRQRVGYEQPAFNTSTAATSDLSTMASYDEEGSGMQLD